MYKILGLMVTLVAAALGGLAFAQESERTQEELAKLPMYERLLEGEDAQKAAELKQSYDIAMQAEDWAEARALAQDLLDLRITKQGADHYEVADARLELQRVEFQADLTPDERRRLAEANQKNEQMVQLYQQGRFPQAAVIGEQVLAAHKKLLGESHPDYATSLNNLAMLYHILGASENAEPLRVQARDLRKKMLGENHPLYANSLDGLALTYDFKGDHASAEPLYIQVLDLRSKLLGEGHSDFALSLNNLAGVYQELGEYSKAEMLYNRACDLLKKLHGESHALYATSLRNKASLYEAIGDFAKAEPLYLQARDIIYRVLGVEHPQYATTLNNLAALYNNTAEYAKAELMLLQSHDLIENSLGENHPRFASSLNNIGAVYYALEEYAKAEQHFLRASELQKKRLGKNHPDYAGSLNNLAAVYKDMGDLGKAETLLIEARDLFKKLFGKNHPKYSQNLNNLAAIYKTKEEYQESELLYVQALNLIKKLQGENHPDYARSLNNIAALYLSTGMSAKAEQFLIEGARSFEMSRLTRASGFQRAIGGDEQNPYSSLATVSARLDKPQQGFNAIERNLSRAFLDVQAQRQGRMLSTDQQARRTRILNELSPLEKRIAVLVEKSNRSGEEENELEKRIEARSKLNVELAELAAELSTQEVSDLASIQQAIINSRALLTWVDVSARGNLEEHWACVLTSSGEPFWTPLPGSGENGKWTEEDSQLPTKLRESLALPVPPSNLQELIDQLRRQRIEPVLAHLKEHGINQLYVVGVGQMAGLPVEVIAPEFTISYVPSGTFLARLPEKPKFEDKLFAVGDPIYEVEKKRQLELTALPSHGLLIDAIAPGGKAAELGLNPGQVLLQYDESKLNSVDDLKAAVQLASAAGAKTAAVTVWSVDEANKPSEAVVNFPVGPLGVILDPDPAPLALGDRRKREDLFASLRGGEDWQDLPGTRYEVEQLGKLFPTATVLLDDRASEATVDALRHAGDLDQFRYLHFATHGKGNNVTAFESKLVLSQDQPKGEIKAGEPWYNNEISAREVLDFWKLNADLVTLSACQTGLGRQGGGDGLLGFAQAFLLSGARSVCLSLWEVDDIATALLMQRFYQNMLGQREGLTTPLPKAKALEEAKQWLRNLNSTEATALTAKLTGGIARGIRGEKTFKLPSPSTPEEIAAGDNYRPYARPHYWSAFILIGEAE